MFSKKMNRLGAAAAIVVMLALTLASPASAAGRTGWGEAREVAGGFLQRVFIWLGLTPDPGFVVKCDQGSQIDPNGCPKATGENSQPVDNLEADDGSQIDPNGRP